MTLRKLWEVTSTPQHSCLCSSLCPAISIVVSLAQSSLGSKNGISNKTSNLRMRIRWRCLRKSPEHIASIVTLSYLLDVEILPLYIKFPFNPPFRSRISQPCWPSKQRRCRRHHTGKSCHLVSSAFAVEPNLRDARFRNGLLVKHIQLLIVCSQSGCLRIDKHLVISMYIILCVCLLFAAHLP